MSNKVNFKRIAIAIGFIILFGEICAKDTEIHKTSDNKIINGDTVVELGRRLKSKLLRSVGDALINLECSMMRCSPWSEWTTCDDIVYNYGGTSRNRTCEVGRETCPGYKKEEEKEVKICEVTKS